MMQLSVEIESMFPAHAGMNRWWVECKNAVKNVPRTRGDEPGVVQGQIVCVECSPHTRG